MLCPVFLADADESEVVAKQSDVLLSIRFLPDEVGVYAELHCGFYVRFEHFP